MYAIQNRNDGTFLTANGFNGRGPAWSNDPHTFEDGAQAELHREECGQETNCRIVEVDDDGRVIRVVDTSSPVA